MSIRYEYIRQNVVINSLIRFGPFSFSGDEFPNNAEGKKLRGDLIITRGALTVVVSRVDKLIEGDKHAGVKTSTYDIHDNSFCRQNTTNAESLSRLIDD